MPCCPACDMLGGGPANARGRVRRLGMFGMGQQSGRWHLSDLKQIGVGEGGHEQKCEWSHLEKCFMRHWQSDLKEEHHTKMPSTSGNSLNQELGAGQLAVLSFLKSPKRISGALKVWLGTSGPHSTARSLAVTTHAFRATPPRCCCCPRCRCFQSRWRKRPLAPAWRVGRTRCLPARGAPASAAAACCPPAAAAPTTIMLCDAEQPAGLCTY